MADETEQQRIDKIEAQIFANKSKPKKTEIKDSFGRTIQTEEISDDGRIIITRTNPNGLD